MPVLQRKRLGLVLGVLALGSALVAPPLAAAESPAGSGRWLARARLPVPRTEISVAELAGKLYVLGGYVHGSVTANLVHEYDPVADSWRERRPLPLGLNHVGAVAHDGKLFAFGGFIRQNRDPVANAFVYDPASDEWREIARLPSPRGAVAAVSLAGQIHLVGGAVGVDWKERRSVAIHEVYDPGTDTYASRAPLPERRDHMGLVVDGGQIHAIGGRLETFDHNSSAHHVYDPKADTWTALPPLPTPRSGFAAGIVDGLIVIAGGEGTPGIFPDNEAYDPRAGRWLRLAPMPTPRHGTGAAVIGGVMYVPGGGLVKGGSRLSDVHEAFTLR